MGRQVPETATIMGGAVLLLDENKWEHEGRWKLFFGKFTELFWEVVKTQMEV